MRLHMAWALKLNHKMSRGFSWRGGSIWRWFPDYEKSEGW